ncbi:MAG: pectin methylesterase [Solobacterium sp.]|nr:pectin methylesterase [Solobacterium sp.]
MTVCISENGVEIRDQKYSGGLYALMIHEDGRPYHTFRTATVLIDGSDVTCRNCTFENTAGPGKKVGQAIALYLDGNNIILENCILEGHQDTLFLAPLPKAEREKDGFLGPKSSLARTDRTVYLKNCLITGDVDFVFGGATAYFDNCEFRSNGPGYIFAPSTPEHVKEGFIVRNCRFTCTDDVPDQSCYIARPWRDYGMVRLEHCELGRHISPQGWHDWNKKDAHKSIRFFEFDSYGPGAEGTRPDYVTTGKL